MFSQGRKPLVYTLFHKILFLNHLDLNYLEHLLKVQNLDSTPHWQNRDLGVHFIANSQVTVLFTNCGDRWTGLLKSERGQLTRTMFLTTSLFPECYLTGPMTQGDFQNVTYYDRWNFLEKLIHYAGMIQGSSSDFNTEYRHVYMSLLGIG